MFTFEQIKELVDLVSARKLGGLEVERAGFRLRIDGAEIATTQVSPTLQTRDAESQSQLSTASPVLAPIAEPLPEKVPEADGHILMSPIVGTFYASPSPGSSPFATVGDRVKKGQVLCIVEAMKLMNEIESDADGVVEKVFPSDGQPVEFGEKLFAITTN